MARLQPESLGHGEGTDGGSEPACTPGATRVITRTVIQALLMTAWGDGVSGVLLRPDVPRDVYDEKITGEQAQIRLNVVAEAVRLYVGESQAAEFTAATPAVKVQLASRAALGMIEDQKKNWPSASAHRRVRHP